MTLEKQEFARRYAALMLDYAQLFEEAPLLAIEQLGHEMVQSNIPPEDIGEIHDSAIASLMKISEFSPEIVRAASLPLMQLLMAYGIAFREVQARHEVEQALVVSEALHREIMAKAFDAIIIADRAGVIQEANAAAADIFGYPPKAWTGLKVSELVPEPMRQQYEDGFRRFISTGACTMMGQCIEVEALHQDGHVFPIELSLCELNHGQARVMATIRDLTERKQSELRVEKANKETESSRAFLEKLIERAQVGIVVHRDRTILMANPYMLKRIGAGSQHMVLGKDYSQFIHPDDRLASIQRIQQLIEHGVEYQNAPVRAISLSGECIYFEVSSTVFQYEGEATILTISIDVTQRHKVSESQRKLSAAVEQAGESILITDRNGIIEYVNPAFTRITGYSAEDAIGQTPRLLNSGNQDEAFYADMWNTITGGKVWHGKVVDRRKDGSFFPAMLTISPIFDASGDATHYTHFIGIQSDLSQLEDMEQRFHQAQKMEAVGTMVGGIAHNFKYFGYIGASFCR